MLKYVNSQELYNQCEHRRYSVNVYYYLHFLRTSVPLKQTKSPCGQEFYHIFCFDLHRCMTPEILLIGYLVKVLLVNGYTLGRNPLKAKREVWKSEQHWILTQLKKKKKPGKGRGCSDPC